MFVKGVLCFFSTLVLTMSFQLTKEEMSCIQRNIATSKMTSRLVQESKRSTVHLINSNSEIIDSFLRMHDLQITVKMENLKIISITENRKIGAALVHLENYGEFETFYSSIRRETFRYDGHFLIIFENGSEQEIEKIFSQLWKIYIYNVNVLVTNVISSHLVSLLTFMPFINKSCDNTKIVQINEFDKNSMKWTTNVFFPEKLKKLNGCVLRVGTYEYNPGVITTKTTSGQKIFSGVNVDLVNLLSNKLKFTPNITEYEDVLGINYSNKTSTGLFKRVVHNEVDFIFGTSIQQSRSVALTATRILYADKLVLVIPPPFLIDPMKKIFLPFTSTSWISIGMVVLIAFCIVITLKFTPKIFHDYVIGNNLKSSILNIWNVLFGGTQPILPKSNFPRFLLAKFLIFTLVIRSLYQGKVFDILKRDVRTVELKTFDEFIEHKFTFHIFETLAGRLEGTKFMEGSYKIIRNSERRSYAMMTLHSNFTGVVFSHMLPLLHENLINRNISFRICRETMQVNLFVFYFTKNFYIVNEFNELISKFHSAGLIGHLSSKYADVDFINKIDKQPPSAFTYEHVEGFFELFYYGSAIAFVCFMCEIIFGTCITKKRKHSNET